MNIGTTFSLKNKKRLAKRGRKHLRRFLTPNMIPGLVLLWDAAIIISAGLASVALYLVPAHGEVAVGPHYVIALVLGAMLQIQFSYSSQHFDLSQLSATGQQLQRVVLVWTVSLLVITALFFLLQIGDRFSRGWLIVWYISALIGLLAFRFRLPLLLRRLRLAGLLTRQAIVVGPQSQLDALLQRLDCAKGAANFDITMLAFEYQNQSDASLRQRIDQTKAEIRKRSIDCVCILGNSDQSTYLHILATELSELPADVVFCSVPFVDLPLRGLMTIHSLPVLRLHDKPLKDWQALLKIIEDRLLATLMLLLFAPVMFLIAVAVKLDSPGPVFFRQARFGFNNYAFPSLQISLDVRRQRRRNRGPAYVEKRSASHGRWSISA
jgi:uncharacterized membrane protein YhaH (DUF805 family)